MTGLTTIVGFKKVLPTMTTLSPSFNPSVTIQLLPTRLPTLISVGFNLLLSVVRKPGKHSEADLQTAAE